MVGWHYENKKDRMLGGIILVVLGLILGMWLMAKVFPIETNGSKTTTHAPQTPVGSSPSETEKVPTEVGEEKNVNQTQENPYDQSQTFSEVALQASKKIAVQFVTAYHTYDAKDPTAYLENSKPYMTEALYERKREHVRRGTLARSQLAVKHTEVVPVANPSKHLIRWNIIVQGAATSVDGTVTETVDAYVIGVKEVDGEWKVEEVNVNVPH
ncbi:hypothetical protein [Thalassobacillus pellis]|uniref:hypothetical protein n=1 Tax=Thalassobacillus pellis TaxID=748008 RepID=UPI0019617344|nr:hypothetical protein [Thalassobacillus pellis]MBM7554568.1 hypothetical protein [Thalassobacillus pellis]